VVPSLFLAHGSPMLAIEDNDYTQFLAKLGETIRPKAIVIFTAHWETENPTVSFRDDVYETIYDFGGFPPELYAVKYPAKGSTEIASVVAKRLENQSFVVKKDASRGLDHGSWTLLYRMYPQADIPVVQVSVNPYLSPQEQFKLGEALQGLGKEDILVIGSGVTVHNLRILKWDQTTPEPWAIEFDDWLIEKLQNKDLDALFRYEDEAPHARLAVPRAEHFVPFYIAMGSGDPQSQAKVIHRHYEFGNLSYLCFQF
jgi:4,5-DOPA dioxygenase extradiol